jgi:copper transport protein
MKRFASGLLAALVWMTVLPAVAGAPATIGRVTPADRSGVAKQPDRVTIRWSEPVDLGPDSVRLLDATGGTIDTPKATHIGGDRATAALKLPPGLKEGTYVVSWRITSADSHPVSGAFSFSIGQPSALVTAGAPGASSGVVKAIDGIARGLSFVGFALAVGGAFVLLLAAGSPGTRARQFLAVSVGALMLGSVALLLLQGPYTTGGGVLGAFKPSLLRFSLSTDFGLALVARIVLTLAFAWLIARAADQGGQTPLIRDSPPQSAVWPVGRSAGGQTPLIVACVVGLALTWTLTDHSRTGVQPWLGVPAATVHLLAMALWFGGLAALIAVPAAREALPRFSRVALGCFVALGVTGVYLAWRQAGELGALPATEFGRLLLVKSAIVLAVIALASVSRRAVPRLARTVFAEVVLGVVILGVTAGLVNAAPARVTYTKPIAVTVKGVQGGKAEVRVAPAKQGQNVADFYLVQPDGRLFIPPEFEVRLRKGDTDLPVELTNAEPGHYVATALTIPSPGDWTLRLIVRTSDIDEQTIDVGVKIR